MLQKAVIAATGAIVTKAILDEQFNLSSDIETASRLLPLKSEINARFEDPDYNSTKLWYSALERSPKKKALVMQEDDGRVRVFTFEDVERESNKVSNFLLARGLKRGDTVALFMENRPEFVISWLGMTKIGVKIAMINTAIKEKGLFHCIKISGCKMVLYGAELADQIKAIKGDLLRELGEGLQLFSKEGKREDVSPCADEGIAAASSVAVPKDTTKGIGMRDTFGYIYTSGTTGLPKAAVILHAKIYSFGAFVSRSFMVKESDVILTVLPLFHSAGGGLGIGFMLYRGCTVVLRKKFTAKSFFADCAKHNVTVVQYIGELCRYLLANPPGEFDKKHKVRIAIGNGLRPDIWNEFQTRFNIPEIGEFYGATEGNAALVNHCRSKSAQGACGRQGSLMLHLTGIKFAKFNVDNEELIRGADGRCIDCAYGEPGELLFPIKPDDPSTTFAGYEDPKATEKKIVRDAFVKGDKYFRTGDLLSVDKKGFIRFVDRIGDTFRCRGENCSTTEVGEVVSTFPGIAEANVYGVLIPNNEDGRFPCAAITPKGGDMKNVDLKGLVAHARKQLPSYSVPMFLRVLPEQEVTATLKLQKGTLKAEGVDVTKVKDPLYYLQGDTYVPLTKEIWMKLCTPGARI